MVVVIWFSLTYLKMARQVVEHGLVGELEKKCGNGKHGLEIGSLSC